MSEVYVFWYCFDLRIAEDMKEGSDVQSNALNCSGDLMYHRPEYSEMYFVILRGYRNNQ